MSLIDFIENMFFDTKKTVQVELTETPIESTETPNINISMAGTGEALDVWVKEIIFNNKSRASIDKNDFIILVGPNNTGKSATLKDINGLLHSTNFTGKIVNQLIIESNHTPDNINAFIKSISKESSQRHGMYIQGLGFELNADSIKYSIDDINSGFTYITPTILTTLTTEGRLKSSDAPKNIKITTDALSHPIHHLQGDDRLELKFSQYFRQAFGTDLIVHRNAGETVPLYIGERPIPAKGQDRTSASYLSELEQRELLSEQGDGMRSFVGVLLTAFTSQHKILLIDEPEAFLHPPQARLLGKMLTRDMPRDRQLISTTHSGDFLRGALDGNSSNLKIIRLNRNGNTTHATVLNNDDINNVWSDSILRHSNILDGLFHSQVIVCESDSDSRFYSAVASSMQEANSASDPDVLFTQCGGKHRIPTVVKAFRKLNVPVKVVTDFDVLNDTNPLRFIYEELGGAWSDVEQDWKLLKQAIEQKRPELETKEVKEKIYAVLDSISDRIFPRTKKAEIENVLRKTSAWSYAKEQGKSFIPNGDASQAYERIQILFQSVGLFIVEVGELEGFVKTVGNHGPKWINEVMKKNLGTDPELGMARDFIWKVISADVI